MTYVFVRIRYNPRDDDNLLVLQIWAKGAKPSNAAEGDIECKESTWGIGANINTKLVNPAGEVFSKTWQYSVVENKFGKLLLAKDSEVRGKPLQLASTYHRRRTLRKTKKRREGNGKPPCQIRDT